MGKNGKLRKKRRLESAQSSLRIESHSESDEGSIDKIAIPSKNVPSDPLSTSCIQNAVACLEYYVKCIHHYQAPECKVLRKSLFPLIDDQKSKYFDPVMKSSVYTVNDDIAEPDASLHDLSSAIATFLALGNNLEFFRSKDMKSVRRALYPFVVVARSASGVKDPCINISGEISNALNLRQWEVVFHKLVDMKRANIIPKLGALQRWVRQCGDIQPKELAIFLLSRVIDLTSATHLEEKDAIMLAETYNLYAAEMDGDDSRPAQLIYLPPFIAFHRRNCVEERSICSSASVFSVSMDNFEIDSCVLGKDRRPPSSIDMNIYRNKKDAIKFDRFDAEQLCVCHINNGSGSASCQGNKFKDCNICKGVCRDEVEGVKGAILLSNVLSSTECEQLIRCAEMLGYYDDAVEGIEALVWIADKSFLQPIFERCKNMLPQQAVNGKKVAGINPRLRFFRYQKGAVYRPHIDGSWTANGDAALTSHDVNEVHSYFTFLFYLNDDFDGGGTTFFVAPSADGGITSHSTAIVAHTVQPIQGSVLCFPHGVVEGSLVHEGSAVIGNGRKYVIRTDLMFS